MPKSFCSGCKFWEIAEMFDKTTFHYCRKFQEADLKRRRLKCNGKLKETI